MTKRASKPPKHLQDFAGDFGERGKVAGGRGVLDSGPRGPGVAPSA